MYVKTDIEQFNIHNRGIYIPDYMFMVAIEGVRYEFVPVADQYLAVAYGRNAEVPIVELVKVIPVESERANTYDIVAELALRAVNTLKDKQYNEPKLKFDIHKKNLLEKIKDACEQYESAMHTKDLYYQGLAMGAMRSLIDLARSTNVITEQEDTALRAVYGMKDDK